MICKFRTGLHNVTISTHRKYLLPISYIHISLYKFIIFISLKTKTFHWFEFVCGFGKLNSKCSLIWTTTYLWQLNICFIYNLINFNITNDHKINLKLNLVVMPQRNIHFRKSQMSSFLFYYSSIHRMTIDFKLS